MRIIYETFDYPLRQQLVKISIQFLLTNSEMIKNATIPDTINLITFLVEGI